MSGYYQIAPLPYWLADWQYSGPNTDVVCMCIAMWA